MNFHRFWDLDRFWDLNSSNSQVRNDLHWFSFSSFHKGKHDLDSCSNAALDNDFHRFWTTQPYSTTVQLTNTTIFHWFPTCHRFWTAVGGRLRRRRPVQRVSCSAPQAVQLLCNKCKDAMFFDFSNHATRRRRDAQVQILLCRVCPEIDFWAAPDPPEHELRQATHQQRAGGKDDRSLKTVLSYLTNPIKKFLRFVPMARLRPQRQFTSLSLMTVAPQRQLAA